VQARGNEQLGDVVELAPACANKATFRFLPVKIRPVVEPIIREPGVIYKDDFVKRFPQIGEEVFHRTEVVDVSDLGVQLFTNLTNDRACTGFTELDTATEWAKKP
jgi:hypothetical protein